MQVNTITRFTSNYYFASNFAKSPIKFNSRFYPTAEHMFQAFKANNDDDHEKVRLMETPDKAKKQGRRVSIRSDWDDVKVDTMKRVLYEKFTQNNHLKILLLQSYPNVLVEGNYWHDNFWGDCYCNDCQMIPGQNMLGSLLMRLRNILR